MQWSSFSCPQEIENSTQYLLLRNIYFIENGRSVPLNHTLFGSTYMFWPNRVVSFEFVKGWEGEGGLLIHILISVGKFQ